ncbi:hypothetical protein AU490_01745 [Lonsdalea populi]|uniref:Copper-binding protein n=1 Tax=Lonsdalea populi TaxID=1172565 RepID=A0A3N0UT19_9GAMM|nr:MULTISPECIES: copper-binding protein [Lonsdalea]RAT13790.1 hypothetical protein AU486_14125 [Lonsdalea quercina]RAT30328.1 hypothetical protein AU490_01745 [Lonsdalea populi]RAT31649.1 hypothetical protein AU491_13895 [Lonsdalea populi]RAT48895.1 hypothetical protein AU496_02315 [Lonsdalea populi]RAT50490.1 hypothetical protein AU497_13110 [Lonsdalea populi]
MSRFLAVLAVAAATLSFSVFSADVHDQATPAGHAAPSTPAASDAPTADEIYHTTGTVRAWSETTVSIAHQAVPALNWPAMTMRFDLSQYQGKKFSAGQTISFSFRPYRNGYRLISATAR